MARQEKFKHKNSSPPFAPRPPATVRNVSALGIHQTSPSAGTPAQPETAAFSQLLGGNSSKVTFLLDLIKGHMTHHDGT